MPWPWTNPRRQPLTILGELVHNETVVNDLRARGIGIEIDAAAVKTPTVMITAHGASETALERVAGSAACALSKRPVRWSTMRIAPFNGLRPPGFHPVIIGLRGHVEVRGLTEDLEAFDIVLTEEDVAQPGAAPALRRCRANDAAGGEGAAILWS